MCREICMEGVPDCDGCADTDPRVADTDDGGRSDGDEVARGSDPLDAEDDPLPGFITGGGIFTCGAAPGRSAPPFTLLALASAIVLVRRRRGGR
jgi:hypothetical protein